MVSFVRLVSVTAILVSAVSSPSVAQIAGGFVTGSSGAFNGAQERVPYLASKKTTQVQKLGDGTTISSESVTREARDSEGRTMVETTQPLPRGSSTPEFKYTMVNDPTNRTILNWASVGRQATIIHLPDRVPSRASQLAAASGRQDRSEGAAPATTTARAGFVVGTIGPIPLRNTDREIRQERLGGKTIAGFYAEGIRDTITIPVQSEGNDRPLVTVHETWHSPDLGIVLLEINEDPRTGTRTTEVTALDRGEPDAALFRIPEGYTVREQPAFQQSN